MTSSKERSPLFGQRRAVLGSTALALLVALTSPLVRAQGDHPVKIILPVATASGVDTITRAAQPALSKALGAPVVVENQPGAGNTYAAPVAKAVLQALLPQASNSTP